MNSTAPGYGTMNGTSPYNNPMGAGTGTNQFIQGTNRRPANGSMNPAAQTQGNMNPAAQTQGNMNPAAQTQGSMNPAANNGMTNRMMMNRAMTNDNDMDTGRTNRLHHHWWQR